jgi:acetyl-CoA synthetase
LLERFLTAFEFSSYEDFKLNYKLTVPKDFNFGFDIVDGWAKEDSSKRALVWCDDHGHEKVLTFEEIRRLSNKAAHFFRSLGIRKGTRVMLILRRRWEYWICAVALHKLGAPIVPATIKLTSKDIVSRANARWPRPTSA